MVGVAVAVVAVVGAVAVVVGAVVVVAVVVGFAPGVVVIDGWPVGKGVGLSRGRVGGGWSVGTLPGSSLAEAVPQEARMREVINTSPQSRFRAARRGAGYGCVCLIWLLQTQP